MITRQSLRYYRAAQPYPIVPEHERADDWRYQLMELSGEKLIKKLKYMPREKLIEWLAWNDVHGIYKDEDAIAEGYRPLDEQEARMCVYGVLMRDDQNWDGYMGSIYLRDKDLAVDLTR